MVDALREEWDWFEVSRLVKRLVVTVEAREGHLSGQHALHMSVEFRRRLLFFFLFFPFFSPFFSFLVAEWMRLLAYSAWHVLFKDTLGCTDAAREVSLSERIGEMHDDAANAFFVVLFLFLL